MDVNEESGEGRGEGACGWMLVLTRSTASRSPSFAHTPPAPYLVLVHAHLPRALTYPDPPATFGRPCTCTHPPVTRHFLAHTSPCPPACVRALTRLPMRPRPCFAPSSTPTRHALILIHAQTTRRCTCLMDPRLPALRRHALILIRTHTRPAHADVPAIRTHSPARIWPCVQWCPCPCAITGHLEGGSELREHLEWLNGWGGSVPSLFDLSFFSRI